jgi:hypothetical protein
MGIEQFIKDPKVYLSSHDEVRVSQTASLILAFSEGARLQNPAGGFSKQFTPRGAGPFPTLVPFIGTAAAAEKKDAMTFGNTVKRHLGISKGLKRTYNVQSASVDLGVRWLPYEAGVVTYMFVDNAATFIGTGELTGCTVAAGTMGTSICYFHAFAPAGTHGAGARLLQHAMIDHIATSSGVGNMIYADNTVDYDGFAFSYGRKDGRAWKMYVYGTNSGVVKFGEVRV